MVLSSGAQADLDTQQGKIIALRKKFPGYDVEFSQDVEHRLDHA